MPLKIILTGATGMIGEGVLLECLADHAIEKILVVGRRPCGVESPKLQEIILPDFSNVDSIAEQLQGYDACLFCLGVSSVGLSESVYSKLTFDLTLSFAQALLTQNRAMTFCYVSGAGTDSSERGRSMWARVKGKTENALLALPFRAAYMFRPGLIIPTPGQRNVLRLYKTLGWLMPLFKLLFPRHYCTMRQLGRAMINRAQHGGDPHIMEVPDIIAAGM